MTRMLFNAFKINVVHHQFSANGTEQSNRQLRVFFISDVHRRKIDEKLLKKIKKNIDLVIIGGDLVEKGVPVARVLKNLQTLSELGPIYFVWGNNDREIGESELRHVITQVNGAILDNESKPIFEHPSWGICGTDDVSSRNVKIDKTLENANQYEHLIFVTHQPKVFKQALNTVEPTLMLAGHTHGGQIRIGNYGLFDNGYFEAENGKAQLLSNGFGTSTVPLRFGAAPECHIITIDYNESVFKER